MPEEINEHFEESREELKRADHLIFVSLKYTRTVDVIKHIVERLINCIDFAFTGLLDELVENGKIEEIPAAILPKCKLIKEQFEDDDHIPDMVDFLLLLRKINRAKFERSSEFRRHVTMTAHLVDDEIMKLDIDLITEYFKETKHFFEYIWSKYVMPEED
ncbi:hypothetical protein HOK51_06030 [Candidatus Woesearchaeota archaeon]|jgi:hypothetical protein|nr:hypothetical protein [Candidatus Woesearchaeota archaeon]MBT6519384.1 hypothetical protein [Candidatus Woesearchaeota archaeon]MBT7367495.1 hypothetical protein [Candidatus Woesearchaeota archaeon]